MCPASFFYILILTLTSKMMNAKAVDGLTISQIDKVQKPMLVAIAVYIGTTRLIDNFIWD